MGLETMVKEAEQQGKGGEVGKTAWRGAPPGLPQETSTTLHQSKLAWAL
jgi:hypothetical protein